MRRIAVVLSLWGLCTSLVEADTVYMRDGKSYSGTVTVGSETVRIDTGARTVEVPRREVVHISREASENGKDTRPKGPLSAESVAPGVAGAATPEPILFDLMRRLETARPGLGTYRIRQQIEQWRIAAHDRKRKANGKWVGPEHFKQHREKYEEILKECDETAARLRAMRVRSERQKAARAALQRTLGTKLSEAAKAWPDPQMRRFLVGVAQYRGKDFARAEMHFRQCAELGPRVAAYHQAHGMALLSLNRPTDAVAAFVRMLRLRPESSLAVHLLSEAVKKVPGMHAKRPVYKEGTTLLLEYPQGSGYRQRRGEGAPWLMPGKEPWSDRNETLPRPSFDRLTFRRAIGVPIGARTLLVDKAVTDGALDVVVQVDEATAVPAHMRRILYRARRDELLPLAMVSVDGYEFTSVVGEVSAKKGAHPERDGSRSKPAEEKEVTIHALGLYEEMGGGVREVRGCMKPGEAGGGPECSGSLMPGDAAAPVLTPGGELAGFLTSRTDASAPGGGKSQFVHVSRIEPFIARARRGSRAYRTYSGHGRAVRKITPRQAEGRVFIVYGLFGERFD